MYIQMNMAASPSPTIYVPAGYAVGKTRSERRKVGTSYFLFRVFSFFFIYFTFLQHHWPSFCNLNKK